MKTVMARVSIIIPIYNAEKYLRETLDCVVGQDCQDWICILVNDGSTDNSQLIIDEFCENDNRFVSCAKVNEGSPDWARKMGWDKSETEWVMHLDSDDVIESSYLDKILSRQEQTGAEVVCSRIVYHKSGLVEESFCIPNQSFDMLQVISGHEALAKTIDGWEITCAGMLYRRHLTKGIVHGGSLNSDEFSFRQILSKAQSVAFVDARYYCRENPESISRTPSVRMYRNLKVKAQIEDFVAEKYPDDIDLCSKAVQQSFKELVSYTAAFWLKRGDFSKNDWQKAGQWLREAYESQNKERLSCFLPRHYKLFCHGFYWFGLMSVLYDMRKRTKTT